jgi:predicted PurR-regulated permease PerM
MSRTDLNSVTFTAGATIGVICWNIDRALREYGVHDVLAWVVSLIVYAVVMALFLVLWANRRTVTAEATQRTPGREA